MKRAAIKAATFLVLTILGRWAWVLAGKLGEKAILDWLNAQIARAFHITSPSVEQVVRFAADWAPPAILAAAVMWSYHWWYSRSHAPAAPATPATTVPASAAVAPTPRTSLLAWRSTPEIVSKLKDLRNENTSVDIVFFDATHFPFAERLASAFEAAGWPVNFNKTAQGAYNPQYHGGVEVKGDNRYFVESIASTLQGSGCAGVKATIGATTIKPSNPKYEYARNKVWITMGYQE
jgi:hypothetical protein